MKRIIKADPRKNKNKKKTEKKSSQWDSNLKNFFAV